MVATGVVWDCGGDRDNTARNRCWHSWALPWSMGMPFFSCQPDRSFTRIHRLNQDLKLRDQLRQEHRLVIASSSSRHHRHNNNNNNRRRHVHSSSMPIPDHFGPADFEDEPEWRRKMRANSGGLMAWKNEQEHLLAVAALLDEEDYEDDYNYNSNEPDEAPRDHTNLRGRSTNDVNHNKADGDAATEADNNRQKKRRTNHNNINNNNRPNTGDTVVDLIVMMSVFAITRSILRICLYYRQVARMVRAQGGGFPTDITTTTTTTTTSTTNNIPTSRSSSNNNSGRAALARLMVPQSIHAHAALLRHARFRAWVTDLNRQRQQHGQPPLSLESLRLVMRESDFNGNDYEALMQFHEEATRAQSMGASQAEIDRCPVRVLSDPNDDLLLLFGSSSNHHQQQQQHQHHDDISSTCDYPQQNRDHHHTGQQHACSICLEAYQLNDRVRRIPCMHEFHVQCIDHWLRQKAVCPICKHPVVGSSL